MAFLLPLFPPLPPISAMTIRRELDVPLIPLPVLHAIAVEFNKILQRLLAESELLQTLFDGAIWLSSVSSASARPPTVCLLMFFLQYITLHILRDLHVWGELWTLPMLTNLLLLLSWWCGRQQVEKIHVAGCLSNLYLSPLLVCTTCQREPHTLLTRRLQIRTLEQLTVTWDELKNNHTGVS